MSRVDLNSDLGESFGAYTIGNDQAVLQYISSANIACGYHAGDHNVLMDTVKKATKLESLSAHIQDSRISLALDAEMSTCIQMKFLIWLCIKLVQFKRRPLLTAQGCIT